MNKKKRMFYLTPVTLKRKTNFCTNSAARAFRFDYMWGAIGV